MLSGCSFIFGPTEYKTYALYHLKPGDNVASVASRFGASVEEVLELNAIDDPHALPVGMLIKVPYRGKDLKSAKGEFVGKAYSKDISTIQVSGASQHIGRLLWPITGGEISSRFGHRWLSFHEGVDIIAPLGTKVRAAHDGQVVYSGDGISGYGNLVVVKGDRIVSVYGHNRRNLVGVGEDVLQGQPLAELGQSGKATGPHLHFEIRIKDSKGLNVAVDPLAFYPRGR